MFVGIVNKHGLGGAVTIICCGHSVGNCIPSSVITATMRDLLPLQNARLHTQICVLWSDKYAFPTAIIKETFLLRQNQVYGDEGTSCFHCCKFATSFAAIKAKRIKASSRLFCSCEYMSSLESRTAFFVAAMFTILLGWERSSVDRRTGTLMTQVRFPGASKCFSPRVNLQCGLSNGVRTPPVRNRMH